MKKMFLIPLMTLMCSVMVWGESTHYAGTFAELKSALSAAANGDIVQLTADIAYPKNGEDLLNITKSITLDGKGHKISGWGINKVTLQALGTSNHLLGIKVTNVEIANGVSEGMPIMLAGYIDTLTIENCKLECTVKSNARGIEFQGVQPQPAKIAIINSHIIGTASGYPLRFWNPAILYLKNTKTEGYCALNFQSNRTSTGPQPALFPGVSGTRGSKVYAEDCDFDAPNIHSGGSNGFACFALRDDGVDITLKNCGMNAEDLGNAKQYAFDLGGWWAPKDRLTETLPAGAHDINITIEGDNSHINGDIISSNLYCGNMCTNPYSFMSETGAIIDINGNLISYDANDAWQYQGNVNFVIKGGTYAVNPASVTFDGHIVTTGLTEEQLKGDPDYLPHEELHLTIPAGYEAQAVKQGNVTLYRVVKKAEEKAPGVKYDLNDDVPTDEPGAGNNPASSFDLSTGTTMELNQATTEAGYVQVKDNGSEATTVKVGKTDGEDNKINQTLVINNGLDVQGESQVIVQAGSALVIGEGGITTEDPENIVIEADEDGAASLLLEPSITVNQTPELTVKMTATTGIDGYGGRVWHRFALPVDRLDAAWEKTRTGEGTGTYLYGWNYSSHDWAPLAGGSTDMTQWNGYTLSEWSTSAELFEVTYTFKGHLAGNMDAALNFVSGYNFFGNSYTGYISAANMLSGIADGNVQGTVWMWEPENQTYGAAALSELLEHPDRLEPWQIEVAPMQTFILRLAYGSAGSASINYADAIWGNPRYGNTSTPAPKRRALRSNSVSDDAYMRIVVTAANGKSDYVTFTENSSLSDAYDDNYDAEKFMNENHFNFYATVSGADYTCVATNSLVGKKMSLSTLNDVNYTMSFKFVEGTRYAVKDNVTGQITDIEEGNTYSFTAQPNAVIDGRFEIVGRSMVVTGVEETELKSDVKGIYTMLGQYVGEDFNALPKGVYIVNGVKVVK